MLPKHSNESAIRFFAKLSHRKGSVRARRRRGVTPSLQIWTRIRARLSGHSIHSPFSLAPLLSKPLTLTRHDVEYQREERESDKEEAHACSFLLECLLLAERERKKKLSLRGLKKRKERRSKAFCEARRKNQLEKKIFFLSHHSTKAKKAAAAAARERNRQFFYKSNSSRRDFVADSTTLQWDSFVFKKEKKKEKDKRLAKVK